MNIDTALERVGDFLSYAGDGDASQYYVGEMAWDVYDHIEFLVKYVNAIRDVPTKHDQQAEMDEWDEFFEGMRSRGNG